MYGTVSKWPNKKAIILTSLSIGVFALGYAGVPGELSVISVKEIWEPEAPPELGAQVVRCIQGACGSSYPSILGCYYLRWGG
jgi:hypothetical protein